MKGELEQNQETEPKGVTTQMQALDDSEYFLMVVFMLLLNRVHVFPDFMFNLNRETWQRKVPLVL